MSKNSFDASSEAHSEITLCLARYALKLTFLSFDLFASRLRSSEKWSKSSWASSLKPFGNKRFSAWTYEIEAVIAFLSYSWLFY